MYCGACLRDHALAIALRKPMVNTSYAAPEMWALDGDARKGGVLILKREDGLLPKGGEGAREISGGRRAFLKRRSPGGRMGIAAAGRSRVRSQRFWDRPWAPLCGRSRSGREGAASLRL